MEQFRISVESSYDIRERSSGQVTRHEMLDRRTGRPVPQGVCCETIFGREGDWECKCGRLSGTENIGYICVRCDEPVVHPRSTRWGHIELMSSVVNPLFIRPLAAILDYTPAALRQVVRFEAFAVVEPGRSRYMQGDLLHADDADQVIREDHGPGFELETGAEAVRKLLSRIDLLALRDRLRAEVLLAPSLRPRLRVIEGICRAAPHDPNGHAARMLLDCIPVLPPAQRLLRSQGGNSFGDSLSTTYALLVERNNRLRKLLQLAAPEVIIANEKRMLQRQVDTLLVNEKVRGQPRRWRARESQSLTERIGGPTRDRLLSRRVDYSASGVLVPDADLPLDAVAIPLSVAVELFRTHILIRLSWSPRARRLLDLHRPRPRGGLDESHLAARRLYREMLGDLGDGLLPLVEEILNEHRLVLSVHADRPAPLVALRPVLGKDAVLAIRGETMTRLEAKPGMQARLHLPLSAKANEEATTLLGVEQLPVRRSADTARPDSVHRSDAKGWFRAAQDARRVMAEREVEERRQVEIRRGKIGDGLFARLLLGDPAQTLAKYAVMGKTEPAGSFLARWMRGAIVPPDE